MSAVPGRLPDADPPGPVGQYPLVLPAAPHPRGDLAGLADEVSRALGRRGYPVVRARIDRVRLEVFLWRFLHSPEWPSIDGVWDGGVPRDG